MAHLVERMTQAPGNCMSCGCGNTPDRFGNIGPFVDLEMDYNWGDSGYLCMDCIGKIAVIAGWISPDTQQEQEAEIARLKKEIHDLNAEIDQRRQRERAALRRARAVA